MSRAMQPMKTATKKAVPRMALAMALPNRVASLMTCCLRVAETPWCVQECWHFLHVILEPVAMALLVLAECLQLGHVMFMVLAAHKMFLRINRPCHGSPSPS